jgi:hypothetical protein
MAVVSRAGRSGMTSVPTASPDTPVTLRTPVISTT